MQHAQNTRPHVRADQEILAAQRMELGARVLAKLSEENVQRRCVEALRISIVSQIKLCGLLYSSEEEIDVLVVSFSFFPLSIVKLVFQLRLIGPLWRSFDWRQQQRIRLNEGRLSVGQKGLLALVGKVA